MIFVFFIPSNLINNQYSLQIRNNFFMELLRNKKVDKKTFKLTAPTFVTSEVSKFSKRLLVKEKHCIAVS